MADLETLDSQIDAVDQRVVLMVDSVFVGESQFDVMGNHLQRRALLFSKRCVLGQLTTQLC